MRHRSPKVRHPVPILLLAGFLALGLRAAPAAAQSVSSAQVVGAIRKGVHFLLSKARKHLFWERGQRAGIGGGPSTSVYGGQTALVLESLLYVQQSLHLKSVNLFKDPLKGAIPFVIKLRPHATYVASFQANALTLLPKKRIWNTNAAIAYDARFLLQSMHLDGGYSYAIYPGRTQKFPTSPGNWDSSNTQYGNLGVWACAHHGLEIPRRYWRIARRHWMLAQHPSGNWGYWGFVGRPTRSTTRGQIFTPAGLASLFISDEFLNADNSSTRPVRDPAVALGLHWLNRNFDPNQNNTYAMYGVVRTGLASGLATFGTHDWYRDYARTLINMQQPDGSWPACFWDVSPIASTAYALLVLDRGLNPVFMNKLQYTHHYFGRWNVHPRDLANVCSWMGRTFETPLNWQVVNIHTPARRWLNAPVLYISGFKAPQFSAGQIAKLRAFVNAGGMVFCSPVRGSIGFRNGIMKIAQHIQGDNYEFHKLSRRSPIYTIRPWLHFYTPLFGLSNGVRDTWIVSPLDIGGIWQRRQFSRTADWQLAENLYLYATGKSFLPDRLQSLHVPTPASPPTKSITVGLLEYKGNWNPEPGAWPRLARLAALDSGLAVKVKNVSCIPSNAQAVPLLHLTGTAGWTPAAADIGSFKNYLDHGGMLFIDSAAGSPAFTAAVQTMLAKIYPAHPLRRLPAGAVIITGKFTGSVSGNNVGQVAYRKFYYQNHHHARTKPRLFGIRIHHRWVVVMSRSDMTSGFLGTNCWGISGLTPRWSQKLAENILLYARIHAMPSK